MFTDDAVSTDSTHHSNDSESLKSEDSRSISSNSVGGGDTAAHWRGRNAAAKALQPPIVERHNLFALYTDLDVCFRNIIMETMFVAFTSTERFKQFNKC